MRIREIDTEIAEYLSFKWCVICAQGKQPTCGRAKYIQRNAEYVRRNIIDNPDYLISQYKKLDV